MKKISLLLVAVICLAEELPAQLTRHIVWLKDKANSNFAISEPSQFLTQRAIERRIRYQIPIDSTDLPVSQSYLDQMRAVPGITILNVSRWLNAVTVDIDDHDALNAVNALPFVKSTSPVALRGIAGKIKFIEKVEPAPEILSKPLSVTSNYYDYGNQAQLEMQLHHGEFLHNIGLRGQGLHIALLDGGFLNYNQLPAFDSMNANNQVLSTWDFVAREESVREDHSHGMMCLSTIAANIPGMFVGKAPAASFHLFRTEDTGSEFPIEEFNWACGAERADSLGADIISSSLGYGYQFSASLPDYPFADLNGDITVSARAADMAAAKGILVFNSAGNSGNDYWKKITTPADGDSVIAVGAVSTNGQVAAFSSYGPSADGRIKPDLASVGVSAMVQSPAGLATANGTSFACPNLAGLAACLWQGFPEAGNMRVANALKESANRFTSPDDRTGFGIPDMRKAFSLLLTEHANTTVSLGPCEVTLNWNSKDNGKMKYQLERKTGSDSSFVKIAEIQAKPVSEFQNQSYQFIDPTENTLAGPISYRILQIIETDPTNFFAVYIDTMTVQYNQTGCQSLETSVNISPNPVSSRLAFTVQTVAPVAKLGFLVFDTKGSLVSKTFQTKAAGQARFEIPVEHLSSGHYFLKVMDADKEVGVVKFLKL